MTNPQWTNISNAIRNRDSRKSSALCHSIKQRAKIENTSDGYCSRGWKISPNAPTSPQANPLERPPRTKEEHRNSGPHDSATVWLIQSVNDESKRVKCGS